MREKSEIKELYLCCLLSGIQDCLHAVLILKIKNQHRDSLSQSRGACYINTFLKIPLIYYPSYKKENSLNIFDCQLFLIGG